ncbi:unnamed protein product [Rotaria sordida]|uniref:Uncharacterized protein n=1 Tax=Rotaria sordida TaxID=392033 RepID=A0A814JAM2_9BILA|nr:unnamed protein product [Rotaria sordida]
MASKCLADQLREVQTKMENLVIQVDALDAEINQTKDNIPQGVPHTLEELNLFCEKITRRTLVNHELERVREERNRLRGRVNQHQ